MYDIAKGEYDMKIELLTDDAIIVELSADDMKKLNITYEEMDYSKIETKRVIWTILSRAGRTLGREINTSGKLLVEAMRRESGGCVLFFSVEQEKGASKNKRYLVKKSDYIACDFDNVSALIACAERISFSGFSVESRLYTDKNKYRLLVRTQTTGAGLIKPCLSEFGCVCGEGAMIFAHTAEHWHCITDKNAVELLSFGKGAS